MSWIDSLLAFEEGDYNDSLDDIQAMVEDGSIWGFQGSIGRTVAGLLTSGVLKFPEQRTYDYWGNPIPTRAEWEAGHPNETEEE